ncbi:hypothetical protein B0H15DRAFT_993868 [Mycena belliarum]|uniref:Uncharacterized protein n=1 Tax=Mycena belliarum TaxID=1033014 RepID=A0AAD6XNN8_9AGAR|nr:hypothetical protein B0H15DRAFT_993868 [Mycena belliae]
MSSKPPSFFQAAVRHVYLNTTTGRRFGIAQAAKWLQVSSGVVNLCVDGKFPVEFLPALSVMRLRRLAITAPFPPHLTLRHSFLRSVTHLDLVNDHDIEDIEDGETDLRGLAALPALTHLCLSRDLFWRAILPLAECACLRLLVLYLESPSTTPDFLDASQMTDPRLVVTQLPTNSEPTTAPSDYEPSMTVNHPQPDPNEVAAKKPGFPASWLVATDQDLIAEADWHKDPTVTGKNYVMDWQFFRGRRSLQPLLDDKGTVIRKPPAMRVIRRHGITGPVVPVCYIRHTEHHFMLIFTTAGPLENGKKTFYLFIYNGSRTEIDRFKTQFDSVASFLAAWDHFDDDDVDELKELEPGQAIKNAA